MLPEKLYLLFALTSAILYAVAASALKAAADRGSRTLSTTLLANIVCALGFLFFMPWGEGVFPSNWWPSLIIGLLFFTGQWFIFVALNRGEASLATPAMGSKAVLVALILALCFGRELHYLTWIATALTSLGLAVFAFAPGSARGNKVFTTLLFSGLSAASFAMFDVLTQIYSPSIGFGRLMPWAIIFSAVISIPPVLLVDRTIPRMSRAGVLFLILGVVLMTTQSILLIWSIGRYHDAAGSNVVYGSRGIWSVLLVWLFGRHFSHTEHLPWGVFVRRMIGALLIAAAVALAFWPK